MKNIIAILAMLLMAVPAMAGQDGVVTIRTEGGKINGREESG